MPAVSRRLALTLAQAAAIAALSEFDDLAAGLAAMPRASEVSRRLDVVPLAAVCVFAAMTHSPPAVRYVREWRTVRPLLRGGDLVDLGVERGPEVAEVLEELRAARLDGQIMDRGDEERFVEGYLAKERIGLG